MFVFLLIYKRPHLFIFPFIQQIFIDQPLFQALCWALGIKFLPFCGAYPHSVKEDQIHKYVSKYNYIMKRGELHGTMDSNNRGIFDLIKEIRENLPVKLIIELLPEERQGGGLSEEECPYALPLWQV